MIVPITLLMTVARQVVTAVTLTAALVVSGPVDAQTAQRIEPVGTTAAASTPVDRGRPFVRRRIPAIVAHEALPFARTELYFGTAKPDGVVSDAEFRAFVDVEITPRFPDGLTILVADGQFRGADDVVIRERSYVVILLYPYEAYGAADKKIDRIRERYTTLFDQESVLRADDPFIEWVSF